MSPQKNISEQLEELLRFERLLSEISATYINIPIGEIENVIKQDLGRLGRLLGADRCNLYLSTESTEDKGAFSFKLPFTWWREEDNDFMEGIVKWMQETPQFFENFQYFFDKWRRGESVQCESLEEFPPEAEKIKQIYEKFGVKSFLSLPISVGGATMGALLMSTVHEHRTWPEKLIPRIRLFGEVFINAVVRKWTEERLQNAFLEIKQLKERFEADYLYLREEMKHGPDGGEMVGDSEVFQEILIKVKQVAPTNAPVLILGETGTGKGLVASVIHNVSPRNERPFMQVNCATLSPSLIESELFGHEKGAFTGAVSRRHGRFEQANGTTLFLDEIGELSWELQAKFLRVLQDGEFERVGGTATLKTDVRIIAATNRDLEKEVGAGQFRRDLWYRLNIFPIKVPPLRARVEDIPLFVNFFVDKFSKLINRRFDKISQESLKRLQRYHWPGNIRELENTIERAVIISPGGRLKIEVPSIKEQDADVRWKSLETHEKDYILEILEDVYWRIEGPAGAARRLGMHPSTLRTRMRKLGIRRPFSKIEHKAF